MPGFFSTQLEKAIDDIKLLLDSNEALEADLKRHIGKYNECARELEALREKYNKLCVKNVEKIIEDMEKKT